MQNMLFQSSVWLVVLASLIATAGISALILNIIQRKRGDLLLAAFGATALLYGIRMLFEIQADQFVSAPPPRAVLFVIAFLSYVVPVPLTGFLLLLFGRGWRNSLLWIFRGAILFAATGVVADAVRAEPMSLGRLNNILIIFLFGFFFLNAFLPGLKKDRDLRIVLAGFLVFGLFALNSNFVSLNLLPWEWDEEAYGFFLFLFALGYVAASRFFRNESRLLAMEREMEIARQIQSSILPRSLPAVRGLELAARYVPMASVAGDFYDVLVQDEKRLCLLVADVSGHGVGAALIASMLKIAFSSQRGHLSDPSKVLAGMNQSLSGKLEKGFVTAACVFIDLETGIMRYASAGHPPLFLFRKGEGEIHELCDNGLILGPFADAEYPMTTMPLEPGDRIIMYTDGVLETRNASGIFFGDGEFQRFIKGGTTLSPEAFIDALLRRLTDWSGKSTRESLDDDLTIMVLDTTG